MGNVVTQQIFDESFYRDMMKAKLHFGKWHIVFRRGGSPIYNMQHRLAGIEFMLILGFAKFIEMPKEGDMIYGNKKLYKGFMFPIKRIINFSFKWY